MFAFTQGIARRASITEVAVPLGEACRAAFASPVCGSLPSLLPTYAADTIVLADNSR